MPRLRSGDADARLSATTSMALAGASSTGISPRQSSVKGGSAKPSGPPGFTSEHCEGIIDPRTHRTLDCAHIQVRDRMKLPGCVKVGQPGAVTGGKGGNS
jgi:hypothetical protein